jgi:hypothetical protein
MEKGLTKTILSAAGILLGIGATAYLVNYLSKEIKKNKAKKEREQREQEEVGNQPVNVGESSAKYDPKEDIKSLASYIIGWNVFYYPKEIGDIIFKLNDAEVKKLNSAWKKKYKKSLYQSISSEAHAGLYDSILGRLKSLGLA